LAEVETKRSQRCGFLPERSRPHFQHSENCPSIVSSQPAQRHGFFTEPKGARVFLRIDLALATFPSSTTQSSGQHSIGRQFPRRNVEIEIAGDAPNAECRQHILQVADHQRIFCAMDPFHASLMARS
jgi:hypothetical protein